MHDFPRLFEGHYYYLLREVLESVDDAVIVFDQYYKIIYTNQAAEIVFGKNKEQLIEDSIELLIPAEKRNSFKKIVSELNASNQHEVQLDNEKEFIGLRLASHFFYAEGKLAKFEEKSAYILVLRDITWRKAIESELKTTLNHLKIVGRKVAYQVEHPKILDEFPDD